MKISDHLKTLTKNKERNAKVSRIKSTLYEVAVGAGLDVSEMCYAKTTRFRSAAFAA